MDQDYTTTGHAQFRQYANLTGRWLSPDVYSGSYDFSNPQSFNRYSYAYNNPLTNIDPSGMDACAYDNGDGSAFISNAEDGGGIDCPGNGFYITTTQQVSAVGFNGNGDLSVYGADGNLFSPDGSTYNAAQSVTVSANGDSVFSGLPDLFSPGFQYATSALSNLAPSNPRASATLSAAGVNAQQQIATAQGFIAAGKIGANATPYLNPVLSYFGGMYGYYNAVKTGGPNDIKNLPGHSGQNPIDVDAGNISFGITCPYGAGFCQFAAGLAQTLAGHPNPHGTLAFGFDTPSDNAGIRRGQAMRAAGCHE